MKKLEIVSEMFSTTQQIHYDTANSLQHSKFTTKWDVSLILREMDQTIIWTTYVKVARWKKSAYIILNIQQNLNFPANKW